MKRRNYNIKFYTIRSRYNGHTTLYERLSAKKYYGEHATGDVLICDGQPGYHASKAEVTEFIRRSIVDAVNVGHTFELQELDAEHKAMVGSAEKVLISYAEAMQLQTKGVIDHYRQWVRTEDNKELKIMRSPDGEIEVGGINLKLHTWNQAVAEYFHPKEDWSLFVVKDGEGKMVVADFNELKGAELIGSPITQ